MNDDNEETPFDALGLTQDIDEFQRKLKELYNTVANSGDDWEGLVDQLGLKERPYIRGYINNNLPLTTISRDTAQAHYPEKPLRVVRKLHNIWEASQAEKQVIELPIQPPKEKLNLTLWD